MAHLVLCDRPDSIGVNSAGGQLSAWPRSGQRRFLRCASHRSRCL